MEIVSLQFCCNSSFCSKILEIMTIWCECNQTFVANVLNWRDWSDHHIISMELFNWWHLLNNHFCQLILLEMVTKFTEITCTFWWHLKVSIRWSTNHLYATISGRNRLILVIYSNEKWLLYIINIFFHYFPFYFPLDEIQCSFLEFECRSGTPKCIFFFWECDGIADCQDDSDELFCCELINFAFYILISAGRWNYFKGSKVEEGFTRVVRFPLDELKIKTNNNNNKQWYCADIHKKDAHDNLIQQCVETKLQAANH